MTLVAQLSNRAIVKQPAVDQGEHSATECAAGKCIRRSSRPIMAHHFRSSIGEEGLRAVVRC